MCDTLEKDGEEFSARLLTSPIGTLAKYGVLDTNVVFPYLRGGYCTVRFRAELEQGESGVWNVVVLLIMVNLEDTS